MSSGRRGLSAAGWLGRETGDQAGADWLLKPSGRAHTLLGRVGRAVGIGTRDGQDGPDPNRDV